jgi:ABC-type transport system substrate-binding protein
LRASGASVVITTDSSQPNLPAILADDEFLISLHPSEASGASASLIGTGPFQFTSASNGTLTLTSNETHWQGRPFIDSIQIRGHKDIRTQWLDLASGRADLVEVPPEQMRAAQQQRLNILTLPASQLLALRISTSGSLSNDNLRAALAYSVDRGALANVIFQKQGQPTASLLPQSLSGYSFLFPLARDLDKARALLAGTAAPRLTLASDADGAMQVVAQRLALNLRDAGFSVQVSSTASPTAELRLSTLPITGSDPSAALAILLRKADLPQPTVSSSDPTVLYRAESDALRHNTIVPLIALPRSWAISARVVDLALLPDGRPDLASAWLEAPR